MVHRPHHDPLQRLNDHHADDLLAVARACGGHPDAISARAVGVDHRGIDLALQTPNGAATAHIAFPEPVDEADTLGAVRVAFVRLARQARPAPGAAPNASNDPGRNVR